MSAAATQREKCAIIGLGKAGTAIGYLLRQLGYPIVAVASRSHASLEDRLRYTGGRGFTAEANAEAAKLATCVFITTPDDSIARVCGEIAEQGGFQPGDKVIHMSGAGGLDLLESARRAGALVASIHPLQSFADLEGAIRNIPASAFGITADREIEAWSTELVRELGGIPFAVPEAIKPLYHAAACMASNYLATLIHMVEETYLSLGLDREEAIRAFWPLVACTLKNIERSGSARALTGPIARGDAGTIAQHVQVLRDKLPAFLPVYREMGLQTVELALQKESLSPKSAEQIRKILKENGEP
ncbi:MAG: DUF2520 domain-containing protein [Deltaproteobacteria bacterium]|nr:DUF2520 domain-containing protein [Deltaproteobacteria bacterium]